MASPIAARPLCCTSPCLQKWNPRRRGRGYTLGRQSMRMHDTTSSTPPAPPSKAVYAGPYVYPPYATWVRPAAGAGLARHLPVRRHAGSRVVFALAVLSAVMVLWLAQAMNMPCGTKDQPPPERAQPTPPARTGAIPPLRYGPAPQIVAEPDPTKPPQGRYPACRQAVKKPGRSAP